MTAGRRREHPAPMCAAAFRPPRRQARQMHRQHGIDGAGVSDIAILLRVSLVF